MASLDSDDEGFLDAPRTPRRGGPSRPIPIDEGYGSFEGIPAKVEYVQYGDDGEVYWTAPPTPTPASRSSRRLDERDGNVRRALPHETSFPSSSARPVIDLTIRSREFDQAHGNVSAPIAFPVLVPRAPAPSPPDFGRPAPAPAPPDFGRPAPPPQPAIQAPAFPLTAPPICKTCRQPSTLFPVEPSNRFSPPGRPYYGCNNETCGTGRAFVCWNDAIGIQNTNHKCYCPGNPPSRLDIKSWRSAYEGDGFYSCATKRCRYRSDDRDGLTSAELERRGLAMRRFTPQGLV